MTKTRTRAALGLTPLLVALLLMLGLPVAMTTVAGPAWAEDEAPADEAPADEPEDEPEDEPTEGEEETEEAAPEIPWVSDFTAAKAEAEKDGKDLFINFTGSDWCGWCKRLESEVFAHAEFLDAATEKFVFVYLDFPRAEELKAKVVDLDLSEELRDAFGVQGFPTIILATADGTPYARTGYQEGGPEAYLEHMAELQEGGAAIKKLLADEKHEDVEALKAAFPVLAEMEFLGHPAFAWTLDAAEKADPDGSLGMKEFVDKEKSRRLMAEEEKGLEALFPKAPGEEPDRAVIAKYLIDSKHLAGPQFLNFCFGLSNWLLTDGDDAVMAKALLERAAKDPLASEHPQAKKVLAQFMERVEAALNPEPEEGTEEGEDEKDGEDEKEADDGEDEEKPEDG